MEKIEKLIRLLYLEGYEDGKKQKKTPYKYTADSDKGKELYDYVEKQLDKAREEGKREVYEAIVFDENIPHDITTFVAANLWKNMRDKAKEELSKLKE